jgi:hypothetical protein
MNRERKMMFSTFMMAAMAGGIKNVDHAAQTAEQATAIIDEKFPDEAPEED